MPLYILTKLSGCGIFDYRGVIQVELENDFFGLNEELGENLPVPVTIERDPVEELMDRLGAMGGVDQIEACKDSITMTRLLYSDRLSEKQVIFLRYFLATGTVTGACKGSGTTVIEFNKWTKDKPENKEFKASLDMAMNSVIDTLEQEGIKRALAGSDKLLIKFLEAYKANKFAPRSNVVHTGTGENGEIQVEVKSWAELAQKAAVKPIIETTGTVVEAEETENE